MMAERPDIDVIQRAVLLACRAPSVHNSQPWRWVTEAGALRLFVDRHRAIPATDYSGREVILSCGAVLNHLCVAMTAAGWEPKVERFPDSNDPGQLASVTFSPLEHVTEAQHRRAEAILQRRADRLPLGRPTYWDMFEPTLRGTFDDTQVTLDVLPDEVRPLLVEASQLTEELRRDDLYYHAELDWWTSSFVLAEGMPPSALASDKESWRVDVARSFPIRSHADRRGEVKADWAKILVLSTPEDTRSDVLLCGEVLSTVLLECTMAGMATCPLTHLIELDESRDIVRELVGRRGEPQVLIRVGIAPPMEQLPPATPRRRLGDVLQIR
ncbi:Acg family FMN-binding oxidoreductase [Mycobacterium nebraskense]|uniref:Acg family FMN-binding oxidoreductase n=1 Tax=Mycobacterium nebraskense TaxID=244292 RepID=UPI000617F29E|nr:NAD(P)H nitroreductase [Mycobacterium nebraskense]KKC04711.1 NAD(P)H nitroreductase [Mycobacterium nebraskense]KLO39672.1 NAD(P)H nitroreductase [Mycobacterium nebraskense]MBI2695407.1 NAD(P)H nitroreductase [Mycobacterium nebraskense]MCV7121387.1 NAD(P)H nitroreductase [Mycobacterium nebraskense]